MPDREKVINRLEWILNDIKENGHYQVDNYEDKIREALVLLKEQGPRLVVKEDFVNADRWGYLPVYVEDRDGTGYWDCITDAALGDTVSRFWTAKPTDKQRKAVKWD